MFVLKDATTSFNTKEMRDEYKKLAHELQIFIYIVEKYEHDAPSWKLEKRYEKDIHSTASRDDLFLIILARKHWCGMLTNDTLRDIEEFRDTVAPFKVLIYDWFTTSYNQPTKESIVPSNMTSKDLSYIKKIKMYDYFTEGTLNTTYYPYHDDYCEGYQDCDKYNDCKDYKNCDKYNDTED